MVLAMVLLLQFSARPPALDVVIVKRLAGTVSIPTKTIALSVVKGFVQSSFSIVIKFACIPEYVTSVTVPEAPVADCVTCVPNGTLSRPVCVLCNT